MSVITVLELYYQSKRSEILFGFICGTFVCALLNSRAGDGAFFPPVHPSWFKFEKYFIINLKERCSRTLLWYYFNGVWRLNLWLFSFQPLSACTPWALPCPCAVLHIDVGLFRLPGGTRERKLYDKWPCAGAQTHMCLVHLKPKLNLRFFSLQINPRAAEKEKHQFSLPVTC